MTRKRLVAALAAVLGVISLSGCDDERPGGREKSERPSERTDSWSDGADSGNGGVSAKRIVPWAAPQPVSLNLELGAGYNEQIANINNSLIAHSGVRWVRAYVNLPRNYFTYGGPAIKPLPPSPQPLYPITGLIEGNIIQELSNVSSDADALAVAALDQLINVKTLATSSGPLRVILSLKHDFSYPYPNGAHVPPAQFPDIDTTAGRAEVDTMVDAIENLLLTNNRGAALDIVVVGNEPMFEIQPNNDPVTAANYKKYLDYLVGHLAALRTAQSTPSEPWDFAIFVGALNSPLDPVPLTNLILEAVLDVARDNALVDGVDLHEHVYDPSEVAADIAFVRGYLASRTTPYDLISTEFSIIRRLAANLTTKQPGWPDLLTFLNSTISLAAAGTPISRADFAAYFHAQTWYPKGWFRRMIEAFEANGVSVVTYGLEETPRYPWKSNQILAPAMPWVVNGVFNATLLGRDASGFPRTNPLVWDEFRETTARMR